MTRYRDIADDLRRRILAGEFVGGSRLPGEERLARGYGVSRGVIRNALAALQRRGMVAPTPGSGWKVHSDLQTQQFVEFRSFAQWARSRGLDAAGRVIHQERAPATALDARVLRMRARDEVLRVTRIRTLGGAPAMLERTTYPAWMIPIIEPLPADQPSVTQAMLEAGVVPAHSVHHIDTVPASGEDADLLGVRRSTRLLRLRRESYARDGRAIESGDDRYVPDVMTFEVHTSASAQFLRTATD
jgi:GntR family transcriptional regulator